MTAMRDYANKSYLRNTAAQSAEESTLSKVAAVAGLVFTVVLVFGMMAVSSIPQ